MPKITARRKSSIKLNKKNSQKHKKYKKIFIVIISVLCSSLFLSSVIVYKFVNQNITKAFSNDSVAFIETRYPTVMYVTVDDLAEEAVKVERLQIRLFDIDGKKVIAYDIPLTYEIDAPGRYGNEQIAKIIALGQAEAESGNEDKLQIGINKLNRTILKLFGLRADRYVVVQKELEEQVSDYWATGDITQFMNKGTLEVLGTNLKSNLSPREVLILSDFIKSLPSDRIITNSYISDYIGNADVVDEEIREIMLLSKISEEGMTIAILNGTDTAGFAGFCGRVVTNNGGRVVAVNNSLEPVEHSVIISDRPDSLTVRKIAETFEVSAIISKQEARNMFDDNEIDRADTVLVIGFDLPQRL